MPNDDRQFTSNNDDKSTCCSFCNKRPDTISELIEGPRWPGRPPASICFDCVRRFALNIERPEAIGDIEKPTGSDETGTAHREMAQAKIDRVLSVLNPQENEVMKLRYGLTNGFAHTHDEIASRLGTTPELVHEIETRAIAVLRSRNL